MSRRKKPRSKNRPDFARTLHSFLNRPVHAIPWAQKFPYQTKEPSPPSPGEEPSLFRQAMAGVRERDQHGKGGLPSGNGPAPSGGTRQEEVDRELFLSAVRNVSETAVVLRNADAPARRSSPGRRRLLRRGGGPIDAELDLHGCIKDEALFRLEHFLSSSAVKGASAVLVITGKGINSPDGPVLRRAVARWLREKGRDAVAEFFPAPREKGGSGAFVVYLKKRF